jgi:hypothetical protein
MRQPEGVDPPPQIERWKLLRQDDNGDRFVVKKGLTKQEAERLVAEFEALGHKQTYWAERESGGPRTPGSVSSS